MEQGASQTQATGQPTPGPTTVSAGWLASSSLFGNPDEQRIKRTFGASAVSGAIHLAILAALLFMATRASEIIAEPPPTPIKVVYLDKPGEAGGGGGSPAPAPKKQLEVPKSKPADPIPVVPPPPTVVPPPPVPTLTAPITTNASFAQASGTSSVSLAAYGGGGSGGGIGSGRGDGVGPGVGGGFGDGFRKPGAGITSPVPISSPKPAYTAEAMRLKLQGSVTLEIEILANGQVGRVRVKKSLDSTHGLDQEAIKAAKQWLFRAALDKEGKSVPVVGELIMDFNLH
jgi:periplasmic protein TonB